MEQNAVIKFCFRLRRSATEIFKLVSKAYGDVAMSCLCVFALYSRFKNEQESLEDYVWEGRPTTSRTDENIKQVHTVVSMDCHIMHDMIVETLSIGKDLVYLMMGEDARKMRFYVHLCMAFVDGRT